MEVLNPGTGFERKGQIGKASGIMDHDITPRPPPSHLGTASRPSAAQTEHPPLGALPLHPHVLGVSQVGDADLRLFLDWCHLGRVRQLTAIGLRAMLSPGQLLFSSAASTTMWHI